ncbi:autotransporter domain-containing protein [Bradyrhizobium sp. TM239]|uniref:autotransporter domain-containing protein n=1 Tax=Bradyrhizobium sp. TM239 TaxID=2599802 RepID=UPI0027D4BF5D|nr:hypothetical protein TM239_07650 [Bradyrhizobium sp. TM239]
MLVGMMSGCRACMRAVWIAAFGLAIAHVTGTSVAQAQCASNTCTVTIASDPGTASSGTTGAAGTLSYALAYANARSSPVTINIQTDVTLAGPLSPIFNSLTINGNGHTIDGGGTQRIFFVGVDTETKTGAAVVGSVVAQTQNVSISNVTLANGLAQGGAAGAAGGGGMGAGGALFVNQSANVSLSGVSFSNNRAIGGAGAAYLSGEPGGGGGLGGGGGSAVSLSAGGGGIFGQAGNHLGGGGGVFGNGGSIAGGGGGYSGNGGTFTSGPGAGADGLLGISGLTGGAGSGAVSSGVGNNGGANGGGGGSQIQTAQGGGGGFDGKNGIYNIGGAGGFGGGGGYGDNAGNGGAGGFGGGGGGGNTDGGKGGFGGGGGGSRGSNYFGANVGGAGGFGGGGGGSPTLAISGTSIGGAGGFGGGGGAGYDASGAGGFGAGDATAGVGGGGGAMGGAVFVAKGGTLTITGDGSTSGGNVTGGTGGNAGSAFGSGIFVQGSTLAFGAGNFISSDVIADQNGSGGSSAADGFGGMGGQSSITKSNGGTLTLSGANTYSGGTTINEGSTLVVGNANALGTGKLTLNGGATGVTVNFNGSFTIANDIAASGDPTYNVLTGNTVNLSGVLSGSGDVVVNAASGYAGTLILSGVNTYTGPTVVNAGILQAGSTSAFGSNSAVTVAGGAVLDLAGFSNAIGSLAGAGTVSNSGVAATLTTGGDDTSTAFSGTIQDGAGSFALTKTGTGLLLLSGHNTYTGTTTVSGGTLQVNGSIASSSLTTVQNGAALSGSGTVGSTVIGSGGIFAPGNGTAGTSMAVSGSLAFASGAVYLVQVSPAVASFASVSGAATLGGATVGAGFASGSYIPKRYTILTASGGVSGTFGSLVTTGLPGNIRSAGLSYDANDVYLDLVLNFGIPTGLNGNQQHVGDALTNFFNTNGGIAALYGALTPAGLTQASGEPGTGSQQTTFNAMSQFMGLLTDPVASREGGPGSASGATGFAEEDQASAYAARKRTDAFAMMTKAGPQTFAQSWSVWAAGFGGSQSTDGNAAAGSNDTTSRIAGTVVGADYRLSPSTKLGFALAGGGTSFGVNGLGSGRSDLFQAGAYLHHANGPAYVSAALAYGWQNITTDRTVTIAGADRLRAAFDANAYSGRLEGGYRLVASWIGGIGLTPYGAAQFTTLDLPAYAEQAVSGSSAFALSYAAKSVTDGRSELGLRTDRSFATQDGVLALRGRVAWAHDFNPDRTAAATFQALPVASFVVSGAAQARDAALTTASVEMKWLNGWSAAATFEGEFSSVTRSYAGKGSVRYGW